MHGRRGSPRTACATVTDLTSHRAAVSTAAQVAVLLAIAAGASFTEHPSASTYVIAVLPEGHVVEQRVRVVNHTDDQVAALYERFGRLPPARLRRTNA